MASAPLSRTIKPYPLKGLEKFYRAVLHSQTPVLKPFRQKSNGLDVASPLLMPVQEGKVTGMDFTIQ